MIRDRGSMKWTSLMLPEHVKALRDWDYHVKHDEEKPILADHELEELNTKVIMAIETKDNVIVKYYDENEKCSKEVEGKVNSVPGYNDQIRVIGNEDNVTILKNDVIDLDINLDEFYY